MGTADGTVVGPTKIVDHGADADRWNLVIVGEGFRANQQAALTAAATAFATALQATQPFDTAWDRINIHRLDVHSTETGADNPTTCGDGSTAVAPTGTARTYFDAKFCNNGIRRLLTVDSALVVTTVNAQVSGWDAIVVVVNHTEFGGSGGEVAVYSLAASAMAIAIHEMGHSAFKLADEYEYYVGCSSGETDRNTHPATEPTEPNVTVNKDRATLKWRHLMAAATTTLTLPNPDCTKCNPAANPVTATTIGLFEGAHYYHCGAYRPAFDCRMRTISQTLFCAVCQETIKKRIGHVAKPPAPSSGICFVATAVYGDPLHRDVVLLQRWRDRMLAVGRDQRHGDGGTGRRLPSGGPDARRHHRAPATAEARPATRRLRTGRGPPSPRRRRPAIRAERSSAESALMASTTAVIARELGRVLEPLGTRLSSPAGVAQLFAELGVPLPASVQSAPAVVTATNAAAASVAPLPPLIVDLTDALATGSDADVAAALAAILPDAIQAYTDVTALAAAVKTAYEASGGVPPDVGPIVAELPRRMSEFLIAHYLHSYRHVLARTAELVGVLESVTEPATATRPAFVRRALRFDRLADLLDDPLASAEELYGWGEPDIDEAVLFPRLSELLVALGIPATVDMPEHELRAFVFFLREVAGTPAALDLLLGPGDLDGLDLHTATRERRRLAGPARGEWLGGCLGRACGSRHRSRSSAVAARRRRRRADHRRGRTNRRAGHGPGDLRRARRDPARGARGARRSRRPVPRRRVERGGAGGDRSGRGGRPARRRVHRRGLVPRRPSCRPRPRSTSISRSRSTRSAVSRSRAGPAWP